MICAMLAKSPYRRSHALKNLLPIDKLKTPTVTIAGNKVNAALADPQIVRPTAIGFHPFAQSLPEACCRTPAPPVHAEMVTRTGLPRREAAEYGNKAPCVCVFVCGRNE